MAKPKRDLPPVDLSVEITLAHLPMPCSVNAAYKPAIRNGRMRFLATDSLKNFKELFDGYHYRNKATLTDHAQTIQRWLTDGFQIQLETWYYFPKAYVFTKTGKPRKFDVTNRTKAMHDCLTKALGFDDSEIFSSIDVKAISENDHTFCHVVISPMIPLVEGA